MSSPPFLPGLFQLTDPFYLLPSQMQMSVQASPVWTLILAKIWLVDITATVSQDGSDKIVTSVSIYLFFSPWKSLLQWPVLPVTSFTSGYFHFLSTQHRCSLASLTFPTCGNSLASCFGELNLSLCMHAAWLFQGFYGWFGFTCSFLSNLQPDLCTLDLPQWWTENNLTYKLHVIFFLLRHQQLSRSVPEWSSVQGVDVFPFLLTFKWRGGGKPGWNFFFF